MPKCTPAWFAAQEVFCGHGGWFIGSPKGFSVGPYGDQEEAVVASRQLQTRLVRAKDKGEMIRIVRTFLDRAGDEAGTAKQAENPTRAGEQPTFWFRSDRYFAVDGVWYFSTREGIDVGPYPSKRSAERDSARLLRLLKESKTREACMLAIHEFMRRPVMHEPLH